VEWRSRWNDRRSLDISIASVHCNIADGEARSTVSLHGCRFSNKAEDRMVIKRFISFLDYLGALAWTNIL